MIDERTIREMVRRVVLRTVQAAADVSTPAKVGSSRRRMWKASPPAEIWPCLTERS